MPITLLPRKNERLEAEVAKLTEQLSQANEELTQVNEQFKQKLLNASS
jgi:predicted nuclease with TOPRIM domain